MMTKVVKSRTRGWRRRWCRWELAALVIWGATHSTGLLAQELPLPRHPDREAPAPERTLPRAAQPGRGEESVYNAFRSDDSLPIPRRPSRDLGPPGDAAGDGAAEDEDAAPPGLTNFLPHEAGGITAEYIYTGEVFSNTRGGISTRGATSYRGNLDLVLNFDTAAMGWWEGGRLFLYGQNDHGRPLSESYVGDWQYFSNIDSSPRPDLTQISECWYQHNFLDNQLWFKIGKQDANANFAYVDLGGDFINSSFGLIPTVPLPTFPNQGLGLASFAQFNEQVQLAGGIYDGAPEGGQWGFNTLGANGYFAIMQLEIKSQWGRDEQLPQTIRVGAWQHSGHWAEITLDPDPRLFNQNYGVYASIDQMVWKEDDQDEQGLGVFGQFGWAPGNRNPVQEYYGAGITYRGWFNCRDKDLMGIGMANVHFGAQTEEVEGRTFETAIEYFYKYYVNDYMTLQPDMQYIVNPGGLYRDALVAGMRFEVVF